MLAWCLQFRRHRRESDRHRCAWRDRRAARYAWCLPVPGCPRGRCVHRPGHRAAEPCRVLPVRSAGTWPSGPDGGPGRPHRGGDLRLAAPSRLAGAQSAGGVVAAVEPDAGRPGKPDLHPDGQGATSTGTHRRSPQAARRQCAVLRPLPGWPASAAGDRGAAPDPPAVLHRHPAARRPARHRPRPRLRRRRPVRSSSPP